VPVPEPPLGLWPDKQHPAVGVQVALLDEVPGDRLRRSGQRGQRQPLLPGPLPRLAFLQAEREQLLRGDVHRLGRRRDWFDEPP